MKSEEGLLRLYEIKNNMDPGEGKTCYNLELKDLDHEV